jgi:hypothetical protein
VISAVLNLRPFLGATSRRHCLLDFKEAVRPRALHAVEIRSKPVFVRELLPQDLKIEINALDRREAARVAGYLAAVVGEAHGRQMQRDERREWYRELRRNRAKALNAPSCFGGALSISSWSISAAILSIAVQCQPPPDLVFPSGAFAARAAPARRACPPATRHKPFAATNCRRSRTGR